MIYLFKDSNSTCYNIQLKTYHIFRKDICIVLTVIIEFFMWFIKISIFYIEEENKPRIFEKLTVI